MSAGGFTSGQEWPEYDIIFLRDNWGKMSATKIGQALGGRTKSAVVGKAHRLGLKQLIASPSEYKPVSQEARATQKREYARRRRAAKKAGESWPTQPRGQRVATLSALESLREIAEQPFKHEVIPMPRRPANPAPPPFRRQPLPPATRSIAEPLPALLSNCPCRWPLGDPKKDGFKFCDAMAELGKPYCPDHVRRAYARYQQQDAA